MGSRRPRNRPSSGLWTQWRLTFVAVGFLLSMLLLVQYNLWSGAMDNGANAVGAGAPADPDALANAELAQDAQRLRGMEADQKANTIVPSMPMSLDPTPLPAAEVGSSMESSDYNATESAVVLTEQPVSSSPAPQVNKTTRKPVANTTETPAEPESYFAPRHQTINGHAELLKFLRKYDANASPNERLFLLFTCCNEKYEDDSWNPACAFANSIVTNTLDKSPTYNRLVIVRTGSEHFWNFENPFHADWDLRLKSVPSFLKWEGKGVTTNMLIQEDILQERLLRYLFHNEDMVDPLIKPEKIEGKKIRKVVGYDGYMEITSEYQNMGTAAPPLFMYFVSGKMPQNERPWCPYCRSSELPMEYGFYAYAPANAHLVLVETSSSYPEWKEPSNPFRHDNRLMIRGVPWFYRVFIQSDGQAVFERLMAQYANLPSLKHHFQKHEKN